MKNFRSGFLAFLCLYIFVATNCKASHIIGSNISYTYMTSIQYKVHFDIYRDCQGVQLFDPQEICFHSDSLSTGGSVSAYLMPGYPVQVAIPPWIPNPGPTSCNGGSSFGIELSRFEAIVLLPAASDDWVIFGSSQFYQQSPPGFIDMPVIATIDNLNFPVNSSPVFLYDPLVFACTNTFTAEILACTEPDGDSLVYSLFPLQGHSGGCSSFFYPFVYPSGFSWDYPFASAIPFTIDAQHNFFFQPLYNQVLTYGISVKEFRNGQLVDSIVRIKQILTSAACVQTGVIENISGHNEQYLRGTLTLYDYEGKILIEKKYMSLNDLENLELPAGFYLYTITRQGGVIKKGKTIRF